MPGLDFSGQGEAAVNIDALAGLNTDLEEAHAALFDLDRTFATLSFDPADGLSVEAAMRQIERAVDDRVQKCPSNGFALITGRQLKAKYRHKLQNRVLRHRA
jgi:hypothetical protein